MEGFFTGFVTGGLTILAVMHLFYQKRLTKSGWVAKIENPSKFWLVTSIYSFTAVAAVLYMVYFWARSKWALQAFQAGMLLSLIWPTLVPSLQIGRETFVLNWSSSKRSFPQKRDGFYWIISKSKTLLSWYLLAS